MLDPAHPIAQLLEEDRRYTLDAYVFLFEALQYAQNVLKMGAESPGEPADQPRSRRPRREKRAPAEAADDPTIEDMTEEEVPQRHVSGQQLCEAIRRYALEQYGYMAKTVLNSWGIHTTGDFGEIVFSLIRIGQMRKTPADARVDFENIYDFDAAFKHDFKIRPPAAEA